MNNGEPTITAGAILQATDGQMLRGGSDWSCRGLSTDTRTLVAGNLFIALVGENYDGHDCLTAAAQKGACGLLIRRNRWPLPEREAANLPVIAVEDTLTALGDIARAWRCRFSLPVVAITGSSGKTTTKEMLAAIAMGAGEILKTEGNLNNLIGLPKTLLGLRTGQGMAIVEMGTNRPGEIARLAAMAAPTVGLVTNIGPAHLAGLGSLAGIREEKGALWATMEGRGTAIFNLDDPQIVILAKRWRGAALTFGLGAGTDVTAREIAPASPGTVRFLLTIAGESLPVTLQAPGTHNVANALAAAACARALGFTVREIVAGLAVFRPAPGRSEVRALANGAHLIVDTYNANPASVGEALKTLAGLRSGGRAVAILGDMLELGDEAPEWHRRIGDRAARSGIDHLYLKGDFAGQTAAGAMAAGMPAEQITFFEEPRELLAHLAPRLRGGDWILAKGSRKMKLEAVAEAIIAAFDLEPQRV